MGKMRMLFIDSYLLCSDTLKAGLTIICAVKIEYKVLYDTNYSKDGVL